MLKKEREMHMIMKNIISIEWEEQKDARGSGWYVPCQATRESLLFYKIYSLETWFDIQESNCVSSYSILIFLHYVRVIENFNLG